jgi:hypothetical protein
MLMALIDELRENKGTLSSELGKKIGAKILKGDTKLLKQMIEFVVFDIKNKKEKNIRSTAAKAIECVAFEKPELVSPYLEYLLPALDANESQTRWVIIRTMGACSKENQKIAKCAIPFAKKYIREKIDGQLCLVSSADRFLGDYGELSKENAKEVFPILLASIDNAIENEHDWIFESFSKIVHHLSIDERRTIIEYANMYKEYPRKKTQERVKKLLESCE